MKRLAEEMQKQEIDGKGDLEEMGAEPVLIQHLQFDYDDETLPLKRAHKIE